MCEFGVLADEPTKSFVFLTFLVRFCDGVAKRKRLNSMVFTVSNAHGIFAEKVGFVLILDTFRAPAGEPFGVFCALLGALFEVLFLTTFEGNRVTASKIRAGCEVPKTTSSMPSLRAKTDPEQAPQDPGLQGPVDKSLRQVGHNNTNEHWHASPLKARWRIYIYGWIP